LPVRWAISCPSLSLCSCLPEHSGRLTRQAKSIVIALFSQGRRNPLFS
jgi:hypothetical protein